MSPPMRRLLLTLRTALIVLTAIAALLFLPPIGARADLVAVAVMTAPLTR